MAKIAAKFAKFLYLHHGEPFLAHIADGAFFLFQMNHIRFIGYFFRKVHSVWKSFIILFSLDKIASF